ncbi:MAG: MarR family transcriptional regulator [Sphingobacteriia bacterium]|jgi:DNA-binding MarR family transcriptional regulator|nr:MAG: MarR family transcriptional regulator [Sphingobacteriia bacterium]TAG29687.1 MAG: MarR family transcriptional regulator [Sphingobacteriia bacterium]
MGIEKDIQQKQFRTIYQKLTVNLIYSTNWLLEQVKLFLQEEDITSQQYNILRILRGSKIPLSTLQIRERMLDKMSDTSRIVQRLLKKGLVEKKICIADKRLVDIKISATGLALLSRMDEKNEQLDQILSELSSDEATILSDLLDKMRCKVPTP